MRLPTKPEKRLLMTLAWLGTATPMGQLGHLFDTSKGHVPDVVHDTINVLNIVLEHSVNFPQGKSWPSPDP